MDFIFSAEIAGLVDLWNPINYCIKLEDPIKSYFKDKYYGEEFISIAVIPVIMPEEYHDGYKERRQLWRKKREADIRLFIDYEKFVSGDAKTKIRLWVKCLVDSIMVIENRKKGDFQGLKLIDDILNFLNIKKEELENL